MTLDTINSLTGEMFKVTMYVAGPPLMVGLVIGLLVGMFQSVTQIQEFTLTFVPKMIAVFVCLFFMMHWMSEKLLSFTTNLITQIPSYIK